MTSSSAAPPRPRRTVTLIAAVAAPVALLVAVLVAAVVMRQHPRSDPLVIAAVPTPAADTPACQHLLAALPERLGTRPRTPLAAPVPPGTVAWRLPEDPEPIVLRCGVTRPAGFTVAAELQVVDGVNWFEVRDHRAAGTWYAVDRGAYSALTLPDAAGPTPLQQVSDIAAEVSPQQPLDPAPL